MAKRSPVSETIMFSVNSKGKGEIVTHHLPFARDSAQLEHYVKKGFTFERPVETKDILAAVEVMDSTPVPTGGRGLHDGEKSLGVPCNFPGCEFIARSEFGLAVHQRRHK